MSKAFQLPPLSHQCLFFWGILCLVLIGYTDTLPALLGISDYLMTFYTAGYMAAHGLFNILYPPDGTLTFAGTPFDRQAHALLPFMPASSVAEYMYMPLSAYIFAPFSLLKPAVSMVAWQITSLAAVYIGNYLIFERSRGKALLATSAAFAFLPFTMTIWIGQVGLVFGLLPLAIGFYLLKKEHLFLAGLAFSLLALKPQMLTPAIFFIVLSLGRKHFAPLAGLITGTALLAQFNYNFFGGTVFTSWMRCLALSDRIYSDTSHGVAVHLATSLPRAILLSQPITAHGTVKPLVYGAALFLLLAGLGATLKLARLTAAQKGAAPALQYGEALKFTFVLGCLGLPMVVPHLFIYDLGALVPAACLLFLAPPGGGEPATGDAAEMALSINKRFEKIVVAFWIFLTIYCLTLVINKELAKPLILVALMLGCYLGAIIVVFTTRRPAIQRSETSDTGQAPLV